MGLKCRVCLDQTTNMCLITEKHQICGEMLSVAEIINYCTLINLTGVINDYVCNRCVNDACTTYTFIKRCETSDQVLNAEFLDEKSEIQSIDERLDDVKASSEIAEQFDETKEESASSNNLRAIRHLRHKSDESSDSDNLDPDDIKSECDDSAPQPNEQSLEILRDAIIKNEDGVYVCVCCPETFPDLPKLRAHTRTHSHFPCKLCKKQFTLPTNLRRHLRTHTDQFSIVPNLKPHEYKCVSCAQTFTRRKQLSEHLKTHKEFSCTICGAKFSFVTNLRKHLRSHNRPKDEIRVWKQPPMDKRTCDICFKVFKYRPSMLKHRKKHESLGKQCLYCTIIFQNPVLLSKHMEDQHESEKQVVCAQCGKRFFKEWNLKMHMLVHTGVKPYMCEICGASFALGGNLASHKRVHTGARPYRCETCGRSFTQQAALKSHEATHSDRRDHVCPDCGAAFSRLGAMKNHQKRHDRNNRPFGCSVCGKRFTFSSERKRHMTIHTGEKKHECDVCGKSFNRYTNLTVHRRIHTGETPHKCRVCGKGFIQVHCLRTHMNTHEVDIAP